MVLYVLLTLRSIPLKGIPNFGEFIKAGKRPKFTTLVINMIRTIFHTYSCIDACIMLCYIVIVVECNSQDPVYPVVFYECVLHCWKQDYSKRPSAKMLSTRLQKNIQSSLVNKYTLEMFSSIPTTAVVSVNDMQCLWAITECPIRRLDDPSVRSKTELTVIYQSNPLRLEVMVRESWTVFKDHGS